LRGQKKSLNVPGQKTTNAARMTFKDLFRKAYTSAGHTSDQSAARALGWSKGRLSNYLDGRRQVTLDHLVHIARTFDVDISTMIPEDGPVRNLWAPVEEAGATLYPATITVSPGDLRGILRRAMNELGIDPDLSDTISTVALEALRRLSMQPPDDRGPPSIPRPGCPEPP
jgi:transcriptional regulator with XRE-family HTH domain